MIEVVSNKFTQLTVFNWKLNSFDTENLKLVPYTKSSAFSFKNYRKVHIC